MIKYFCDKCGKEVAFKNELTTSTIKIPPGSIMCYKDQKPDLKEDISLCPVCQEELRKWLNMP